MLVKIQVHLLWPLGPLKRVAVVTGTWLGASIDIRFLVSSARVADRETQGQGNPDVCVCRGFLSIQGSPWKRCPPNWLKLKWPRVVWVDLLWVWVCVLEIKQAHMKGGMKRAVAGTLFFCLCLMSLYTSSARAHIPTFNGCPQEFPCLAGFSVVLKRRVNVTYNSQSLLCSSLLQVAWMWSNLCAISPVSVIKYILWLLLGWAIWCAALLSSSSDNQLVPLHISNSRVFFNLHCSINDSNQLL